MEQDLVCRVPVDEKTTAFKSTYQGKEYYFCCEECKADFDDRPQVYTASGEGIKDS